MYDYEQLQINVPQRIDTSVVTNCVALDISCTLVTNIWSKWTRFLLVNAQPMIHSQKLNDELMQVNVS